MVLWPCADTDLRWMSPLQLGRDRTRSSWRRQERGRKSAATSSGRAATPPSARKEHQHSWRWSWMKSVEHRYNKSVWKTKFAWNRNLFPAFLSLQFHFMGVWLLWHLLFFLGVFLGSSPAGKGASMFPAVLQGRDGHPLRKEGRGGGKFAE